MIMATRVALRCLGISGILGALVFVAGDLLYHHVPGSHKDPSQRMSAMSDARLLNAGVLGLIGCWLYALGAGHVYLAFSPVDRAFGFAVFLLFAAVMISYGICHTAYFAIGSGAKLALQLGSQAESGARLGNALYQRLLRITYVPVALVSLLMAYGIVTGHSMYPRWMVMLLPVVIYLLKAPIVAMLKGHSREIISDAYDNVTLLAFYLISTLVLWG